MSLWIVYPQIQEFEESSWTHEKETQSLHRNNRTREARNKLSPLDSRSQENEFEDRGRYGETTKKNL